MPPSDCAPCLTRSDPTSAATRLQYDAQVTVGGVPCIDTRHFVSSARCFLPAFDYDPAVAYDVVVYNDAGSVTLPGVVQYTSAPTLVSIDPCIDRGAFMTLNSVQCPPGTTLTLRGLRFPTDETATVRFFSNQYTGRSVTLDLLSPVVINNTTITGQSMLALAASCLRLLLVSEH